MVLMDHLLRHRGQNFDVVTRNNHSYVERPPMAVNGAQ